MSSRVFGKISQLLDGPTDSPNVGESLTWDGGRYQPLISTADKNFTYTQNTPQSIWTVVHNLNKYPAIQAFEDFGSGGIQEIEGQVDHINMNTAVITFNASVSGFAICN